MLGRRSKFAHLGCFWLLGAHRWIVAGARLRLPCFQFRRLRLQSCLLHSRPATLGGIFLAIDRRDMRGVAIEIRAPDPKLLLVRIDPLPQHFAGGESLQGGRPLDAKEVGATPVALAPAGAPAME